MPEKGARDQLLRLLNDKFFNPVIYTSAARYDADADRNLKDLDLPTLVDIQSEFKQKARKFGIQD